METRRCLRNPPTGWSVIAPYALSSLGNNGIHGYSEVPYAFTSAAANNGSAFAGINANTPWFNLALAAVFATILIVSALTFFPALVSGASRGILRHDERASFLELGETSNDA